MGRRESHSGVTKNLKASLTKLQRSCVEMGEPVRRTTTSVALDQLDVYGKVTRQK